MRKICYRAQRPFSAKGLLVGWASAVDEGMGFLTLPWIGFKHFRLTLDESGGRESPLLLGSRLADLRRWERGHSFPLGSSVKADKSVRAPFLRSPGGVEVSIHIQFYLPSSVVTVRSVVNYPAETSASVGLRRAGDLSPLSRPRLAEVRGFR